MSDQQLNENQSPGSVSPLKGGAFLVYVTLISGLAGFGLTVAKARKSSPKDVNTINAEGTKLAMRALGYGTAISVSGCGLLVLAVAKALGVSSVRVFLFIFLYTSIPYMLGCFVCYIFLQVFGFSFR